MSDPTTIETNEEALELLEEFATQAQTAVQTAVWAQAYLTEGGEATWDAVKSVATSAELLADIASRVRLLPECYDDITPF